MSDSELRIIDFRDVRFRYPGRDEDSIKGVSISVKTGEAVLITGKTGCGKSTLLKMLNGIIPHESSGELQGNIYVCGIDTRATSIPQMARRVGIVFQTPDDQLFCTTVYDELAFGPENLGLNRNEIDRRVEDALKKVGLEGFGKKRSADLSGGQKQRVAIASQLTLGSKVLALDEPISQLDPTGAREVMDCLALLKSSGITVIIVEHRIPEVLRIADRIIVLDSGRVVLDIPKKELPHHTDPFLEMGLKLPAEILISAALQIDVGENWREGVVRGLRERCCESGGRACPVSPASEKKSNEVIMELEEVSFRYPGASGAAVDNVSLKIREGDIVALMGHNGCGKSTLLEMIAGLLKCREGRIKMRRGCRNEKRPVGMVFQNPDLQLIEESVDAELMYGPLNMKKGRVESEKLSGEIKKMLGLERMGKIPPHSLSKGQRLRTAVGAVLALSPLLLALDEPTTGQNLRNIRRLVETIGSYSQIKGILFSTHDVETAALYANRIILMKEGKIIADGTPADVMTDSRLLGSTDLYIPEMVSISMECGIVPPAITFSEMIAATRGGGER